MTARNRAYFVSAILAEDVDRVGRYVRDVEDEAPEEDSLLIARRLLGGCARCASDAGDRSSGRVGCDRVRSAQRLSEQLVVALHASLRAGGGSQRARLAPQGDRETYGTVLYMWYSYILQFKP